MNNIERKLLSVTLTNVNIDLLEEIINATPNPSVAVEIMCGLYVEPNVPQHILKDDVVRTLISFDKWNDNVSYSYEQKKTVYEYFPAGTKKEDVSVENYKSLVCGYSDDAVRIGIVTGEVEIRKDNMRLEQWMKYHATKPYVIKEDELDWTDVPVSKESLSV